MASSNQSHWGKGIETFNLSGFAATSSMQVKAKASVRKTAPTSANTSRLVAKSQTSQQGAKRNLSQTKRTKETPRPTPPVPRPPRSTPVQPTSFVPPSPPKHWNKRLRAQQEAQRKENEEKLKKEEQKRLYKIHRKLEIERLSREEEEDKERIRLMKEKEEAEIENQRLKKERLLKEKNKLKEEKRRLKKMKEKEFKHFKLQKAKEEAQRKKQFHQQNANNANNAYPNPNPNHLQLQWVASTSEAKWQCSLCRLENDYNTSQCNVCGTQDPNQPMNVQVVAVPCDDGTEDNLDCKEAFKAQLKAQQTWCYSYWKYLHIVMIALIILCLWNAYNQYYNYQLTGDLYLMISIFVFLFGVFAVCFGLYGMYNCIPVSFLLLTIYIVVDIVIDIYVICILRSWLSVFFLLMWAFYLWQFYPLYQFTYVFKKSHR